MPRILILGATGYIGEVLALSLTRSGEHTVFGLARTAEKATHLRQLEVIPVAGSVTDSAEYVTLIRAENIDVVVDATGANDGSTKVLADVRAAGAERLALAKSVGVASPKLGLIYVSGTWVHGSSDAHVSDLDPVAVPYAKTQPPALVAWRPKLEQAILGAADVLDVAIIRPSLVYGREHAIWNELFSPIRKAILEGKAKAVIATRPESWLGLIHVDDVASGLHAAINSLPAIASTGIYPIFDLATSRERMSDVLAGTAKALEFAGELEYVDPSGSPFREALCTSFNGTSSRAKQLLGWEPRRLGLARNMDIYASAWLAYQD